MTSPTDKVTQRLERLKKDTYRAATPTVYGQKYFYVFGWTKNGKAVCWGPFMSQHEADSSLTELDDGEVFQYDTRDLGRATRQIKAELLARGEDPDVALRRMLHKRD